MAHLCPVCEEYCTCDIEDIFWNEDEYDGPCFHHEQYQCGDDYGDEDLYEEQHQLTEGRIMTDFEKAKQNASNAARKQATNFFAWLVQPRTDWPQIAIVFGLGILVGVLMTVLL